MKVTVQPLKEALTLMSAVVDEVGVVPKDDGWSMAAKSVDSVAIADIMIKKEAFTDYAVSQVFAFDVKQMLKALSKCGPEADISVDGAVITVRSGQISQTMRTIANIAQPRVPELEQSADAMVPADSLRVVVDADKGYDQVDIEVSPQGVKAAVLDEAGMGVTMTVSPEETALLDGSARAQYPLSHLTPVIRAVPRGSMVDMKLSTDYPMEIHAVFPQWTLMYMIAPRINSE